MKEMRVREEDLQNEVDQSRIAAFALERRYYDQHLRKHSTRLNRVVLSKLHHHPDAAKEIDKTIRNMIVVFKPHQGIL